MLTSPASVNLMALPTRLSRTCVRRCLSPRPIGSDLPTDVVSVSFLFLARDSVAARTVSTTLSIAYSLMFRVNWPDSILAMSSTVLISPSRCLPLERMRVRGLVGEAIDELDLAFGERAHFGAPNEDHANCLACVDQRGG
jgi:hypothetical protein